MTGISENEDNLESAKYLSFLIKLTIWHFGTWPLLLLKIFFLLTRLPLQKNKRQQNRSVHLLEINLKGSILWWLVEVKEGSMLAAVSGLFLCSSASEQLFNGSSWSWAIGIIFILTANPVGNHQWFGDDYLSNTKAFIIRLTLHGRFCMTFSD